MRCHTSTNCKNTLSRLHACDVFRRSLKTNKNNLLASLSPLYSVLCREYDLAASSTRRCAEALAHRCSSLKSLSIELGVKKSVKVSRVDHLNSLLLVDHALVNEVTSDLEGSLSCSLTVSCLKHEELTVLNSELHVLHISVMILKSMANILELLESLGELVSHLGNLHRSTNASNNVLTLCICKELTKEALCACCRVTGESNTGTAIVTHVTECH